MGAGGMTFGRWGLTLGADFQLGEVFQRAFVELGWIFNLGRLFQGKHPTIQAICILLYVFDVPTFVMDTLTMYVYGI